MFSSIYMDVYVMVSLWDHVFLFLDQQSVLNWYIKWLYLNIRHHDYFIRPVVPKEIPYNCVLMGTDVEMQFAANGTIKNTTVIFVTNGSKYFWCGTVCVWTHLVTTWVHTKTVTHTSIFGTTTDIYIYIYIWCIYLLDSTLRGQTRAFNIGYLSETRQISRSLVCP